MSLTCSIKVDEIPVDNNIAKVYCMKATLHQICPICKLRVQKSETWRTVQIFCDTRTQEEIEAELMDLAHEFEAKHPILVCLPCRKKLSKESE